MHIIENYKKIKLESKERVIRINKVLRDLNISLERAIDFLKAEGIIIDANPNAKISESERDILYKQFSKDIENLEKSKEVGEIKRREKELLRLNREKEIQDREVQGLKSELITNIFNTARGFYFLDYFDANESNSPLYSNYTEYSNDRNFNKDLFKSLRKNSIIFGKSVLSQGYEAISLQVKAIGIIVEPISENAIFEINWLIKDLEVEVLVNNNKDNYTDVVLNASIEIVKYVFSLLNVNQLGKLSDFLINPISEIENQNINMATEVTLLPGLLSDVETGVDHLDIKKDVEAFARTIATKNFEPPLAIALLGKWGSGKSFFMHKLKEDIKKLSLSNPRNAFCEGIAHVHFNAWSYMDANLWASFVTRIFEGLEEYIKSIGASEQIKKEIEEHLFQKLNISKEELKVLNGQKEKIDKQIKELESKRDQLKIELDQKIASIRMSVLTNIVKKIDSEFNVKEQIEKTLTNNSTFVDTAEKFEKIVPKEYWSNPEEFVKQLKSSYAFFKAFFIREKLWINIIWILSFLFIVLAVPIVLYILDLQLSWHDFTISKEQWVLISINGALFLRAVDTFLKLKKQIAPFWKIKEDYDLKKKETISHFKQEEKVLNLEIQYQKEEIAALDNQILVNEELKANLDFKLKNALSTEALYTFIEKRANSEDYKKHLGIVSLIRKDFEILSGLLTGHATELVTNEESDEFKLMFKDKKPLERIILYIDDLDRCPEDRVVEVLEAVNLLMAFPLFVVIVGVDPRWVKTALHNKYENQFKRNSDNEEKISPANYLEKIFQVPFHLKDADDLSIKNMIENLASTKIDFISDTIGEDLIVTRPGANELFYDDHEKSILKTKNLSKVNKTELRGSSSLLQEEQINALDITVNEIYQIKSFTKVLGNNPRCVKRFINIYRIIKTHKDFECNEDTKENELLIVMFFLALSIGKYKDLIKSFEVFLDKITDVKASLSTYFEVSYQHHLTDDLFNANQELKKLLLANDNDLLKQKVSLSRKHYQFIKRFTFKNI